MAMTAPKLQDVLDPTQEIAGSVPLPNLLVVNPDPFREPETPDEQIVHLVFGETVNGVLQFKEVVSIRLPGTVQIRGHYGDCAYRQPIVLEVSFALRGHNNCVSLAGLRDSPHRCRWLSVRRKLAHLRVDLNNL